MRQFTFEICSTAHSHNISKILKTTKNLNCLKTLLSLAFICYFEFATDGMNSGPRPSQV